MPALEKIQKQVAARDGREVAPPRMAGHLRLVTLQQLQEHQMSAVIGEGIVQYLRGPVDRVQWKELHTVHDAIKAAIVRAGLATSEALKSEPFLLKIDTGWNPGMDLWGDQVIVRESDLPKIKAVIETVLSGLKRDAANSADDLAASELDSIQRGAARQVIAETLDSMGGKRLALPLHVRTDDGVLTLEGKLGAKPSRANFHPVEEELHGRFVGFDLQKNELLFLTSEKRIQINFAPTQVDLLEVARAAMERQECVVRTHKTIARNGTEDRAYLPDRPFQALTA